MNEAGNAMGALLAQVGHELRTPLNAVRNYALMLRVGELNDEQRKDVVRKLCVNAERLTLMIENLGLHGAGGQVNLHYREFRAEDLVEDVVASAEVVADVKGIALTTQVADTMLEQVMGDKERLVQIVLNLVSNALKFTPSGGTVEIVVEPAGADWWQVAVKDTGRGIAAEDLERIFEPFVSLGRGTAGERGLGLGLWIAREMCEAMGGRLSVASMPDMGSTFTVILPRTPVNDDTEQGTG